MNQEQRTERMQGSDNMGYIVREWGKSKEDEDGEKRLKDKGREERYMKGKQNKNGIGIGESSIVDKHTKQNSHTHTMSEYRTKRKRKKIKVLA